MKSFTVARHGDYDECLNLSDGGKTQMRELARALKKVLGEEGSTLLLSSSAPRAIQSVQVLSDELGIREFETYDELWSDNSHREDAPRAMGIILNKSDEFDNVIVMTHLEYTTSLPLIFAKKNTGMQGFVYGLYYSSVPKGSAWHMNCIEQTCDCIPE